jgi:hypothetical protein
MARISSDLTLSGGELKKPALASGHKQLPEAEAPGSDSRCPFLPEERHRGNAESLARPEPPITTTRGRRTKELQKTGKWVESPTNPAPEAKAAAPMELRAKAPG